MNGFKNKFIGGCELLLLFGRGVNRFAGSKGEAFKSLPIPLLIYAASFVVGDMYIPPGMEGISKNQLVLVVVSQYALSFIVTSILTYEFARLLKKQNKFWLFFSASNWTSLPLGVIALPVVYLASAGFVPHDQLDHILLVLQLYSYAITGCIAYAAFRINWQLAVAVGVANMFIDQQIWRFIYAVLQIPMP